MAITKDVDPAAINQNQTSVFTLEVTNNGPSVAQDVLVKDDLPSGLEYVSDDARLHRVFGDDRVLAG